MCPLTLLYSKAPLSHLQKKEIVERVNTVKSVHSRKSYKSTACCSTHEDHEEYFKLLCVCYHHGQKTAEEKLFSSKHNSRKKHDCYLMLFPKDESRTHPT
jgi:hypothetical protein